MMLKYRCDIDGLLNNQAYSVYNNCTFFTFKKLIEKSYEFLKINLTVGMIWSKQ